MNGDYDQCTRYWKKKGVPLIHLNESRISRIPILQIVVRGCLKSRLTFLVDI
jgi:hypothetical protein